MTRQTRKTSKNNIHILALLITLLIGGLAQAGTLVHVESAPYGEFRGIEYVRYTGRFVGTTEMGDFRVPFEIVAPQNPELGNRTVLFEPPHFILGTGARESILGPELLFNRRFSHASVGFSNENFNLLDVFAEDAVIAGQPVRANVPVPNATAPFPRDVEILRQFALAIRNDPSAFDMLGPIQRTYAYGVSQSAEAIYELIYGPGAEGLFDLTLLHVPLWRPPFARPDVLAALPNDFEPLDGIGRVMLVVAEGDLLISESLELRAAASNPNYRIYEVAGAPHLADDSPIAPGLRTNPLDVAPTVRAAFIAGHRWIRFGFHPPRTRLLESAPIGEIDPFYLKETGIARDVNGNAAGGVRYPDVANGRAFHLASALDVEVIPGLAGLIGFWSDLACAPAPGSESVEPRFGSRREYLRSVRQQIFRLLIHGYILPRDARDMLIAARESGVGDPAACEGVF